MSDDTCPICLEEMKDDGLTIITKCGHEFHRECLDKWLPKENSCPLCRNKDIWKILISNIRKNKNKHYVTSNSLFRPRYHKNKNGIFYLHQQSPQAWLNISTYESLLPLYILMNDKGKKPKFISYYLRQLILWEDVDELKVVYKYDDTKKLYICSNQQFSSCSMTNQIMTTLVEWLYVLLWDLRKVYKFEYLATLNTLIIDLTIYVIVNYPNLYDKDKYQLILIASVYNCIKFYNKNRIINFDNLIDEEFKKKLIWYTDDTYIWDQELSNKISDMIELHIISCWH